MTSRSRITSCSNCGYVFREVGKRISCPNCNSTARTTSISLEGFLPIESELEVLSRGSNFPLKWWIVKLVKRIKLAKVTGYWAREELRFDRTDPHKTVKTHHVEELQQDRTWKVEHDEQEEYPSKKRPWLKD